MTVSPGTKLGPYEIFALIGTGGMGEVYRAKDTRLDRTVAIKILPAHLSSNPDLKQRFEREARTISSLSHPNICSLYDIGHQEGIDFLVMEFLEGETLAERLSKGALPMDQVLRFGMQIADALDKAHKQGIVHRDLKPGNIMITKSGIKLLDFGLAKLQAPVQEVVSEVSALPTKQRDLTAEGAIVGTLQYMSPEQLEGRETDTRTDIFAKGLVLYEMATGRKAFTGKSQASLIAAILSSEPTPISTIQPMSPPAFDRLVKNCLAKDPDDRWQTAHDVMLELSWISEGNSQAGVTTSQAARPKNRELFAWAIAVLLLGGMMLLAIAYFRNRPPPVRTFRLMVNAPEATTFTGSLALSSDGSKLCFTTLDAKGTTSVWIRNLDSVSPRQLPGTETAQFPFWSPDGRSIGFFAQGKLKKIEIGGGPPVDLVDVSFDSRGGTWNRNGEIVFAPGFQGPLYRIPAAGGKAIQTTTLDEEHGERSHRWPVFLPDGRHFSFLVMGGKGESGSIYVGSLDGAKPKFLMKVNSIIEFAMPNYILFHREQTLMAQRFDSKKFELDGEPFAIADLVAMDPEIGGFAAFSVSENGILAYRSESNPMTNLAWIDRTGRALQKLDPPGYYLVPRLSPNGSLLAVSDQNIQTHNADIWLFDVVRGIRSRFMFGPADETYPVWSNDGGQIVFGSDREGVMNLYLKSADGSGQERLLLKSNLLTEPTDWSSDGRFILYEALDPVTKFDLWILPLFGDRKPFAYLATPFVEWNGQFSSDGRWISYTSNESGKPQVYVRPFPGPGQAMQISVDGGKMSRWRKDGKELFYVGPDGKMMAVALKTDTTVEASPPVPLFDVGESLGPDWRYDVSADGQRFLVAKTLEVKKPGSVTIVLNWAAGIKQ